MVGRSQSRTGPRSDSRRASSSSVLKKAERSGFRSPTSIGSNTLARSHKAPDTARIRMYFRLLKRMFLESDKRLLWKLGWNMGFKGMLSVERFKRRLKRGEYFPPFLYVSVINSCNLRCQGCWVDVSAKMEAMSPETFHRMVRESREMGNVFFGIVGGEPFMHPHLFELLEPHPDCYFQIFT